MRPSSLATAAVLAVTAIWGSTFFVIKDAVGKAKDFVRQSILHARAVGHHHPLGFFWNKAGQAD